jgi:hypothetical protein
VSDLNGEFSDIPLFSSELTEYAFKKRVLLLATTIGSRLRGGSCAKQTARVKQINTTVNMRRFMCSGMIKL